MFCWFSLLLVMLQVPAGGGKQVKTPSELGAGRADRAEAFDVHDDVGEGDQIGQQLVLQQRREVARAAHRQHAAQPRAGDVGFEEDAVLVVVDVAGGAARVRALQVGEELDLAEAAVALLGVAAEGAGERRRVGDRRQRRIAGR